jgi:1-deoxy-D-xylulose-5-phosphate reductoisomerase
MNKGLEVIEARWLFDMPLDRIRVLIHPQAVIHSIVELCDGSCLAQMSICDMRLPIQYALSFPERWPTTLPRVRLTDLPGLQFFEPDLDRFPCLRLALDAAGIGGTACAALSAANDVVVEAFLREELPFLDLHRVIAETLEQHTPIAHPTMNEILAVDAWARHVAREIMYQSCWRR